MELRGLSAPIYIIPRKEARGCGFSVEWLMCDLHTKRGGWLDCLK
jgi:hypothetical protein